VVLALGAAGVFSAQALWSLLISLEVPSVVDDGPDAVGSVVVVAAEVVVGAGNVADYADAASAVDTPEAVEFRSIAAELEPYPSWAKSHALTAAPPPFASPSGHGEHPYPPIPLSSPDHDSCDPAAGSHGKTS